MLDGVMTCASGCLLRLCVLSVMLRIDTVCVVVMHGELRVQAVVRCVQLHFMRVLPVHVATSCLMRGVFGAPLRQ